VLVQHAVIQRLGRRLQRPVQRAQVRDPAVFDIQHLGPHRRFDRERMAVDTAIDAALGLVREVVGGVEGRLFGDLEDRH
jgi:hypothetical protein